MRLRFTQSVIGGIYLMHRISKDSRKYPGVAQMVERVVWDHEAAGSRPVTRTKGPWNHNDSKAFFVL